ncbi:MAG: hypothetical protein LBE86_07155 [Gemmobacter sp.]|nr:hypothetical protein [Gemmobacter sp.]
MIRPEALALVARWGEAGFAAAVVAAGLWLARLGGWVLPPIGLAVMVTGAGLLLLALRRLRFRQDTAAPGLVEIDESQISYFGPAEGGFVSLRELVELRLLARGGHRFWRLKQADGQALLVPVDAAGAERLYDAFAALPGIDMAALLRVLRPASSFEPTVATDTLGPVIWRRDARPALT